MTTPSFDSADVALVEEVISQADARLQGQLTVGLAADQRAMTFAGLLFAGVAVLVGLAEGGATSAGRSSTIALVAVGFLIAAGLACWSARPIPWHISGNLPSSWEDDVARGATLKSTRAQTASNYEALLSHNERAIQNAARFMKASMIIALGSALIGVCSAAS